MRFHLKLFRLVAGSLVMMTALSAVAEKCNIFSSPPAGGGCCFKFVIQGDQRCNINTGATATDCNVNPFACNGGSSTVTVSYDSTSNTTTVTICGAAIQQNQTFHYPPGSTGGNGLPHIGLDGGNNGSMNIISSSWVACSSPSPTPTPTPTPAPPPPPPPPPSPDPTPVPTVSFDMTANLTTTQTCATTSSTAKPISKAVLTSGSGADSVPSSLPLLSLSTTQSAGSNPVYYTLYLTGTDAIGNVIGGWYQQPYPAGTTPTFQIVNSTSGSITITSAGFITNDSQRSLDSMNFGELSPPGYAGSPFAIPNPSLNGTVIPAGGSIAAPTQ